MGGDPQILLSGQIQDTQNGRYIKMYRRLYSKPVDRVHEWPPTYSWELKNIGMSSLECFWLKKIVVIIILLFNVQRLCTVHR